MLAAGLFVLLSLGVEWEREAEGDDAFSFHSGTDRNSDFMI